MVKVTVYHARIDHKDIDFKICYSPRTERFYVDPPEWMTGVVNQQGVTGRSQAEVERNLRDTINEYGRLKRTEKKVIFYLFTSQVRPFNFDGANSGHINSEEATMCSEGVALDLWFRVGYVIKDPTEQRLLLADENHANRTGLWGFRRYMDYSPERLKFFFAFREYLTNGIEKMAKFFSNQKQVTEMIDTAIKQNALPFMETKK